MKMLETELDRHELFTTPKRTVVYSYAETGALRSILRVSVG
jgi:hypothetical protein